MAGYVKFVLGISGSGKTETLLDAYRVALRDGRPAAALWLAPTSRAAADIRGRLLDASLPACLSPGVMTFEQFARTIVDHSPKPIRSLSEFLKRRMLSDIVTQLASQGKLKYFTPICKTDGFHAALSQWMSEIKRLEIWPDDFLAACQKRGLADKDRELYAIYNAYQQQLTTHGLYDSQGCFWSARELLREGQPTTFDQLDFIVADGFTDFTWTQYEMLELLAPRVSQLVISLPMDPEHRRQMLFSKVNNTLEQLKKRFRLLDIKTSTQVCQENRWRDWPAMGHLCEHLFEIPGRVAPASDAHNIDILPAHQATGETREIARRIKSLLLDDNILPGDIAVVYRSLDRTASLVREVFDEFGLPYAIESIRPLGDSPALRSLIELLKLARDDWPFRQVLKIVCHSGFRLPPSLEDSSFGDSWSARSASERAICREQIPRGREALLARLIAETKTSAEHEKTKDDKNRHGQVRGEEATIALAVLRFFQTALDALPQMATVKEWSDHLTELARAVGIIETSSDDTDSAAELLQLTTSLVESAELSLVLSKEDRQMTLEKFLPLLAELLEVEQLPQPREDEVGRIRVLSAQSIRCLNVDYLFVAGLSEQVFPPATGEDPMYGEAERAALNDAGLRFTRRVERTADEMHLFYEVVSRASRYLCLSYPAVNEKAEPLLPSPFLIDVCEALGQEHFDLSPQIELSRLPHTQTAHSPCEARLLAVNNALSGDASLLAELSCDSANVRLAANLSSALETIEERGGRDHFGPHEGMLESEAVRAALATRFNDELVWSASRLDSYASCPFRFLLDNVIRLRPLPDLTIEVDRLRRGRLLHDAIAEAHVHLNDLHKRPTALEATLAEDFLTGFHQNLDAVRDTLSKTDPVDAALLEIELRILSELGQQYLGQYQTYVKNTSLDFLPAHFEASFGLPISGGTNVDAISTSLPLEIIAEDKTVRIGGRVDRIDISIHDGQNYFAIVDYKSGGTAGYRKKENHEVVPGRVQLELYTMAVEDLLLVEHQSRPWLSAYWFVRESGSSGGFKKWVSTFELKDEELTPLVDWQQRRADISRLVVSIVDAVRDGNFPVSSLDEKCTGYCQYHTVCRINQLRSLEKTWDLQSPTAD